MLAFLIVGAILALAFLVYEATVPAFPILPPYLFKNITATGVFITTFINGAITLVQIYYLPTYFQIVRGKTAIISGVLLLPLVIVQVVNIIVSGLITSKTGKYRMLIWSGFAIWSVRRRADISLIRTDGHYRLGWVC